jgi:hypothetical protein
MSLLPVRQTMLGLLLAASASSGHALVTVYTSAASFSAAVTGVTTHGFNGIAIPLPNNFLGGPQTVDGVTFSSSGNTFTLPTGYAGTAYGAQFFSGQSPSGLGPANVSATLAGTFAIAFTYGAYNSPPNAPVTITLSTGDVVVQNQSATPGLVTTFTGFVSSTPITSVSFSSNSGVFDVVNFMLTSPVPEAPTWALLLAGTGLIGGLARKRSARHLQ